MGGHLRVCIDCALFVQTIGGLSKGACHWTMLLVTVSPQINHEATPCHCGSSSHRGLGKILSFSRRNCAKVVSSLRRTSGKCFFQTDNKDHGTFPSAWSSLRVMELSAHLECRDQTESS